MPIDVIPEWLLFFISIGIVLASVEIGYRFGRRKLDRERESPVAAITAAILGLQAFILAFTFGIVAERFEDKKALVREDANVIRTAWARLPLSLWAVLIVLLLPGMGVINFSSGKGKSTGTRLPAALFKLSNEREIEIETFVDSWDLTNIRVK